jgi:hypothetical protein
MLAHERPPPHRRESQPRFMGRADASTRNRCLALRVLVVGDWANETVLLLRAWSRASIQSPRHTPRLQIGWLRPEPGAWDVLDYGLANFNAVAAPQRLARTCRSSSSPSPPDALLG